MKSLSELPTDTLLFWYASAEPADQYTYIVRQAYALGYVLTKEQARREVHRRLLEQHLLPTNRPATPRDYARIKKRIRADRFAEDHA